MKFFLAFLITLSSVYAGNEGGHGGDPYAYEFRALGTSLSLKLNSLENSSSDLFSKWKFEATSFTTAVDRVRVVSAEPGDMVLNGEEVDAINFPQQNKIKVNRGRWRESDLSGKLTIVLHEYFGILGVERDHFRATDDFSFVVTNLLKEGITNTNLMVQFFYGREVVNPPLSQTETCQLDSVDLTRAIERARQRAKSKCEFEKDNCVEAELPMIESRMSKVRIGARYCEIISVFK